MRIASLLGGLATLLAVLAVLPVRAQEPSWECRVCEDVLQTWHDHYRCAGETENWGNQFNADIKACQQPRFDCDKLVGRLKAPCKAMVDKFYNDPILLRDIWELMMHFGKVYRTCATIGECPPDKEDELDPCHKAFQDSMCDDNPECPDFTRKCSENCYLCNWIIRDWPMFQEICRPEGVNPDDLPRALAKSDQQPQQQQQQAMPGPPGTGSTATNPMSSVLGAAAGKLPFFRFMGQSVKQRMKYRPQGAVGRTDSGYTLQQRCFETWEWVQQSPKAKYFASWDSFVNVMPNMNDRLGGTMWDANVACKCLGKCELDQWEYLSMIDTCKYDESDERAMNLVFASTNNFF